ncbi:MAG: hypothetical protein KJ000_20500 [Pirellulaceae bacterium]|jgi:hypothetical protein|nr:hypothetical protein [Pirellulaceae bacterium]
MSQTLEERVAKLERTVAELLAKPREPRRDDWRKTIGMFTGDTVMREIDDEALKIREQDRRETRL